MSDRDIYKGWTLAGEEPDIVVLAVKLDGEISGITVMGKSIGEVKERIDKLEYDADVTLGIRWTKIEEMPDHLRDGRDVLLHYELEGLSDTHPKVIIGYWDKKMGVWVWQNRASRAYSDYYQPNYFAEINSPKI